MQKYLLFLIPFLSLFIIDDIFATAATCSPPPPMIDLSQQSVMLASTARDRALECLTARSETRESSIKEYVCPSGVFDTADRPYTREILSYQIAVATIFQAVDTVAIEHAKSLQCLRQKDPIVWQQSNKVFTDPMTGYAGQYELACKEGYIIQLLNGMGLQGQNTLDIIQTSDVLPQSYCQTLANAKIEALNNLVTLIAGTAIGKSYQNDKDEFLTRVKGKYASLLEKSSRYFRTMSQAVAKLDAYIKVTIQ